MIAEDDTMSASGIQGYNDSVSAISIGSCLTTDVDVRCSKEGKKMLHGCDSKKTVSVSVALFCIFTFFATASHAASAREINRGVNTALDQFSAQVQGGSEFLKVAKGVMVIPNIVKAGLGVGGEYGEGAMKIEGKTVDYYALSGGSIGFQAGAEKVNLVLIFMQEQALKKFRESSGWKAGVDGTITFIDKGKEISIDTTNIKDPIVGFFGQRGLMASISVEDAKFTKIVRE
jgi:lipid-binding SYLF domain-containing protein